MKKRLFVCAVALLVITVSWHCAGTRPSAITQRAFYYWETRFRLTTDDQKAFSELQVRKLYLRLFDVDLENNQPTPAGTVFFNDRIPGNYEVVPVVFITNRTIKELDSSGIRQLSVNLLTRVLRELKRTHIQAQVNELQIDCDWTDQSRNKYFYLLQQLRNNWPHQLSATIRLHQYKYHHNNTPPVDKGVLMCYNVNDVTDPMVGNALFDEKEVMKYIEDVEYPLPLDLAMPAFSWGVHFNAAGRFAGFWKKVTLKEMQQDTNFVATAKPNLFRTRNYIYRDGEYLPEGEYIRVEEPDTEGVKRVINYLKTALNNKDATLILFQYHAALITHESTKEIQSVFDAGH